MVRSKPRRSNVDSYVIKGINKAVRVGDTVLMRNQEVDKPPYVAKLEKMWADGRNNIKVLVRWYYRPEESIGGRRQFHGAKEVFMSDHIDVQSADTIEGKCAVHTFKSYTKLNNVDSEDYFCRFEYKAATGAFTPDRVAVYCKCEMPYNPDDLMVQCEECKDWFHPVCMNLSPEQVKNLEHFYCFECASEADGEKGVVSNGRGMPPLESKECKKVQMSNRKCQFWKEADCEATWGLNFLHQSRAKAAAEVTV